MELERRKMMRIEDMKRIVDRVTHIQKTQEVKIDIKRIKEGLEE